MKAFLRDLWDRACFEGTGKSSVQKCTNEYHRKSGNTPSTVVCLKVSIGFGASFPRGEIFTEKILISEEILNEFSNKNPDCYLL